MKCKGCNATFQDFWRVPEEGCAPILEDLCGSCRAWAFSSYLDHVGEPNAALTGDLADDNPPDET